LFVQYLLKDVIPTIESGYRVVATADSCAIAGMSVGSEQALAIRFVHPELFSLIGALGPFMPRELADRRASALADPEASNTKRKGLWIACVRQEPDHLSASRKQHETLERADKKRTYLETEGGRNMRSGSNTWCSSFRCFFDRPDPKCLYFTL
jgi:enterochelin esterase-like enzyme